MAVILYWRERLAARNPIRLIALQGADYRKLQDKAPEDTWPKAVAKQALLQDYKAWFDEVYLDSYRATQFYIDQPELLPPPATDLEFFTTMSPLLHIVGRDQQTRAYFIWESRQHEGRWVKVKVRHNFVRLCDWQSHVAAFELQTGGDMKFEPTRGRQEENVLVQANGITVAIRKIAQNREALQKAVGRS